MCLRYKIVRIYNYSVVVGCTSRWVDSSLSFHRIPKEDKHLWLNVIKRKHWAPTNNEKKRMKEFVDHFISALKEGNVLFNDALNTFYLRLYGVRHMVKDHSDRERRNLLSSHGLLALKVTSRSSGSRYIAKPTLTLVALSVPTDRDWRLPTVGVAGWCCQYIAVHWGLGLDPRLAEPTN